MDLKSKYSQVELEKAVFDRGNRKRYNVPKDIVYGTGKGQAGRDVKKKVC